jgi:hypothetical protein
MLMKRAGQHFVGFGKDIQNLAQNLGDIVRVVENARLLYQQYALRSPQFRGFSSQKDWDLTSLCEIIGNSKATLEECNKLLTQNREIYRNQNSIYSNKWPLVIQPKVNDLQKRVRVHSFKTSALLKPLEVKLLATIRQDFGNQTAPDNLGRGLPPPPLQGLLILDIDQAVEEQGRCQPIPLTIPAEIETKLRSAAERSRPELRVPGGLPLQSGVETLINYFEESTKGFTGGNFLNERTPSPKQYLNLLSCIMILRHLQESEELKHVDQNSLWPAYIAELAEILRIECQRFATSSPQRLVAPDLASLNGELAPPDHGKLKKEEISNLMSPHYNTHMDEVFKVPLPSPQDSVQRQLTISRIDSNRLYLVESVSYKDAPSDRLGQISLDIDLKTVQLTPIYATPSSRPNLSEVQLHTGTSQLNISFVEQKHVLRLQHLLTGYRVYDRYDQAMVKVSFFVAGQSTPLEEHGRIQLWLPQPFIPANKAPGSIPPSSSMNEAELPAHQTPSLKKHSPSQLTPSNRSGSILKWVPGLRRSSGATGASSKGRGNNSGSSVHPISPLENLGVPAPVQSGPFELAADSSTSSYSMNPVGLHPVSPDTATARPADGYPSFGSHNQSPRDTGSSSLGYHGGSSTSRNTTTPGASNGHEYSSLSPNNVSRGLQPPNAMALSDSPPTSATSMATQQSSVAMAAAFSGSGMSNHLPFSSTSPSFQGHNGPTAHQLPAAPSTNYTHVLRSRSSRATASVMSTMSTHSYSSLAPTVSTIKTIKGNSPTSSSGIARLHHKPQKPLLVIFLKSREAPSKLSIVAIQIDNHTSVKRERCECYNSHSSCRISCVERERGGSLLAQRWDSDAGLHSWNLAALGESQRKESQDLWPNLRRVSMKFEKMEGKFKRGHGMF